MHMHTNIFNCPKKFPTLQYIHITFCDSKLSYVALIFFNYWRESIKTHTVHTFNAKPFNFSSSKHYMFIVKALNVIRADCCIREHSKIWYNLPQKIAFTIYIAFKLITNLRNKIFTTACQVYIHTTQWDRYGYQCYGKFIGPSDVSSTLLRI